MAELENLGVRVVSGRLGRKAGEEDGLPESSSKPPGRSSIVVELSAHFSSFAIDRVASHRFASQMYDLLLVLYPSIGRIAWAGDPTPIWTL
jgi:hypothetical protein